MKAIKYTKLTHTGPVSVGVGQFFGWVTFDLDLRGHVGLKGVIRRLCRESLNKLLLYLHEIKYIATMGLYLYFYHIRGTQTSERNGP